MLSTPVSDLKGVGCKISQAFKRAGINTVADLINWLPYRHEDFSSVSKISNLKPGKVTILAKCESIETKQVRRGLKITTAVLSDGDSKVRAVWFNQPYRSTQLLTDKLFLFSGSFEFNYNRYQITNPSVEMPKKFGSNEPNNFLEPVYHSIKGINPRQLRRFIESVRPTITMMQEIMPQFILKKYGLISRSESYLYMHFPKSRYEIVLAKNRLAFDELFEILLASQLNKQANTRLKSQSIKFDQLAVANFVKSLPFSLTNAQRRVLWQIIQDFESSTPMNRLLQGDVGSGKTVVAGSAAYICAHAGLQSAIMVPTEILALQHAETLQKLLSPFGVKMVLLTGSVKGVKRKCLLENIANGEADVIIGTHALIQKTVVYKNLGFVVVDEQHRFGVKQRQELLAKSSRMPHLLAMTATPIPRSLQLTVFGELDISTIDELPSGRKPIKTQIWAPTNIANLYDSVEIEISKGRQVYIICSLIDDNPENDTKSVEIEYRKLRSTIFNHRRVAMLHGKMKPDEKDKIMNDFSAHKIDILISTTVVEVGVNVPNATIMIIENADKFGLSQLHQLRGRVGRGEYQSYCHLIMSDHSKPSQRLREIEKSNDGFHLAEVDLKLRGPGEIYGKSQHGTLDLRIASISDTKMVERVQLAVRDFINSGEDLLQYKQLSKRVQKYQRLTNLN